MSTSDGSTADYYELPAGATELQDLISHRNLNAQDGEIFRAIYRKGRASHSDELRDARKVLFYAQAEVKRLEKLAATPAAFGQQNMIDPADVDIASLDDGIFRRQATEQHRPSQIFTGVSCMVCGHKPGHGGLQCPTLTPMANVEPASAIEDTH